MTGLGAAMYLGFFTLAALWLFFTSDAFGRHATQVSDSDLDDQIQRPDFSNSTSAAADAESFSPDLISHSSSK